MSGEGGFAFAPAFGFFTGQQVMAGESSRDEVACMGRREGGKVGWTALLVLLMLLLLLLLATCHY